MNNIYRTYGLKKGERMKHTDGRVDWVMVLKVIIYVKIGFIVGSYLWLW